MQSYNDAAKTLSIPKNCMLVKEKENSEFVFLISSGITHDNILDFNRSSEVQLQIGKVRYYVFRVIIYPSYFKLTILFFTRFR